MTNLCKQIEFKKVNLHLLILCPAYWELSGYSRWPVRARLFLFPQRPIIGRNYKIQNKKLISNLIKVIQLKLIYNYCVFVLVKCCRQKIFKAFM